MLNENQINALPERIVERLRQINTEYLESIGAVIKNIGELRPKDVHQLQQMYDYGADLNKITLKLAEASKKNISEIYEIFDIVAKENYNYARPFYDAKAIPFIHYDDNKDLKQYVKSLAKQTVDEYVNITQHTAFAVFDKTGKDIAPLFDSNIGKKATSLSDTYTKIVDYAVTKVQLGEESYQSAMREAMKALANSGIKNVHYATGYHRRLDTAVRQNILWGVKECNQNIADMVGEEFGADGYEVSYHSHPRPSHADMGGQQYAKGPARTVNGVHYPSFEEDALPLLNEFHCLHFKFSILLGVSKPAYDKKTLEKFKAEDNKTFKFEGKTYTKYEASQVQRKLETSIRYQRDLLDIAKAATDNDLELEARDKINILLNKYSKFSDASGLPTKLERTRLAVTSKDIDKSVKSGIMDTDGLVKVSSLFINKNEKLFRYAENIKPVQDFEDILCHANPDNFLIDLVGKGNESDFVTLTPEKLAEQIKLSSKYHGGKVRLISCQSGAKENGAAQRVANALGVEVLAPTEIVNVDPDGRLFISDNEILAQMWYEASETEKVKFNETGKWIKFKPKHK